MRYVYFTFFYIKMRYSKNITKFFRNMMACGLLTRSALLSEKD